MINRILSGIFLLITLTFGCRRNESLIVGFTGFVQGTTYSITYDNNIKIDNDELKVRVESILHNFDMSLSIYKDSSIVSRANRNENPPLDSFFTEVFQRSVEISEMTAGAFDITVGPLVRAWGFGPDEHKNFSSEKRDSLMNLVGMEKVYISNGKLIKTEPGVYLDVNAIAQGYSVDVVYRLLEEMGINDFLVEIGGEVRTKGTKKGNQWRIGIDRPEDNILSGQSLQAVILLRDKSLATSGNYRKFYVEDGVKYSHTIDPRTGYPAKNRLLSATIISDDCMTADGIATACMVMGLDSSIAFIESHPQYVGYFVYSDTEGNFKTWISEDLKKDIEENN